MWYIFCGFSAVTDAFHRGFKRCGIVKWSVELNMYASKQICAYYFRVTLTDVFAATEINHLINRKAWPYHKWFYRGEKSMPVDLVATVVLPILRRYHFRKYHYDSSSSSILLSVRHLWHHYVALSHLAHSLPGVIRQLGWCWLIAPCPSYWDSDEAVYSVVVPRGVATGVYRYIYPPKISLRKKIMWLCST